ncbi:MAG: hypothetical protein ABIM98_01405 [candidate division WOR-3 bacterium]
MMKKFLFFILSSFLFASNFIHEFSLSLLKGNVPLQEFAKVSNAGFGIELSYRLRIYHILCLSLSSDYSYFIPQKDYKGFNLFDFNIGFEYVPFSFKNPFSPYLRISSGIYNLKQDVLSQRKIGFGIGTGFYISLLDFNFSYNNILTSVKNTSFLSLGLKYRIPVNE